MSQNDSQIVVHNHIEGFSNMQILTVVFFVVITSIIVVLLIIAVVILLMLLLKKSRETRLSDQTLRDNLKDSACQTATKAASLTQACADNPAMVLDDDDTDIISNSQNIPMSVLRSRLNDQYCDSPESTPSAYENLYPSHHDGEILNGPQQPKLMTFAGRVFAATKRKATFSKSESRAPRPERKPSSAKEPSSSLEWDYFESRPYYQSRPSDASDRSEVNEREAVDVCWV